MTTSTVVVYEHTTPRSAKTWFPPLRCRYSEAVLPFSNSVVTKTIRKKIPFRSSRKLQKLAVAVRPLK